MFFSWGAQGRAGGIQQNGLAVGKHGSVGIFRGAGTSVGVQGLKSGVF